MIRRHHQSQIEGKQRLEVEIAAGLHVRGEQQVELAAEQGIDGIKARHRLHLQIHPGPLAAKIGQQRQQPLDAAVAIERQMQPARIAALQGLQLFLGLGQSGQYLTGEGEQLAAGCGQYQRATFAQVELQIEAGLQLFELVGEGGLGKVEGQRRTGQRALLGQRGQCFQVFDLYPCIAWHCHKMAPCEIAYGAEVAVGGGLLRLLTAAPLAPVCKNRPLYPRGEPDWRSVEDYLRAT